MNNPSQRNSRRRIFALPLLCLVALWLAGCSEDKTPETAKPPEAVSRNLGQAMQERIRSGSWTREEALVENLRILAGERSLEDVYGSEPVAAHEGTGLLLSADRYLKEGGDTAAKAELQRLIALIMPEREWLMQRSQPVEQLPPADRQSRAPAAALPFFSLITDAHADPTCAELWAMSQPPRDTASARTDCFDRLATTLPGGYTLELYYPTRWRWGSPRLAYVEAARESVAESFRVYQAPPAGLFARGDVYVVLGEHEDRESRGGRVLATARGSETGWCGISVWRYSYGDNLDAFRQTMAHETFHCFQKWNISNSNAEAPASDWWFEAVAEYFSNVVYPCVDNEHGQLEEFHKIHNHPIFDTDYGNFVFFQYMANRDGLESVLRLQRDLSLTPLAEQPVRFAAWPDMSARFREFAETYIDGHIRDACPGRNLPAPPLARTLAMEHGREYEIPAPRFSIPFVEIRFDGDEYRLNKQTSNGSPAKDSARDRGGLVWAPLPETPNAADAACLARPKRYLWFPLNTSAEPEPFTFVLRDGSAPGSASADEEDAGSGPIDRCLVGRWEMDADSVFALGRWLEEKAAGNDHNRVRFQGTNGTAVAELTAAGRIFGETRALQPSVQIHHPERVRGRRRNVVDPARTDEMAVHVNGASCSRWSAEDGLLTLTDIREQVTVQTVVRTGDGRTIIQDVSPGAAPAWPAALQEAMNKRVPRAQGEAMKNIWREIVEPIMAAEGIAPPTAEQRQQMRDIMRSMLGGGRIPAAPPVERVEQLQLRYQCRGDSVELELPDTDLPPVRMRRQN